MVPIPSVYKAFSWKVTYENETRQTGGEETRLGLERFTKSERIAVKSTGPDAFGGRENPSLTWTLPETFVPALVETKPTLIGCAMAQPSTYHRDGLKAWTTHFI